MIFFNNMQNVNVLKIFINVRKRPGVTMLEYELHNQFDPMKFLVEK